MREIARQHIKRQTAPMKTAALYARFSSDLQRDRSIDDQFAVCERYAHGQGLRVVAKFHDRAKTGATLFDRDGIMEMRNAAKRGEFDAVIVESLDRLSRDQEDLAGLFKRLKHYGVALLTANEGVTTDIHVGVRGIVGAMFLKDLASKVKRGHNGRVREGKVPGTLTYGYDRVWDEAAREYRAGERVINHAQAEVIRRIFREYADGVSPREIANGLTRDNIPTPGGLKDWNHQAFVGGRYQRGMISNRIYIGELVWNVRKTLLDPDTGKKIKRPAAEDEHITTMVPELRIVDQELWDKAQAVRQSRAIHKFGPSGKVVRRPVVARGSHLLSGMLRCGVCNGSMRIAQQSRNGAPRVACAAAHQHSTCTHRKTYDMAVLEKTVLDGMRANLIDPEQIDRAVKAFHAEYQTQAKRDAFERGEIERKLNRLRLQIERLVTAISDSDDPVVALLQSLKDKEAERVALEERLRLLKSDNVITLHPNVIESYTANIQQLHDRLTNGSMDAADKAAFHNLVDTVIVHETPKRMPYDVSVYGRLSAIMGVDLFPTMRSVEEIVADEALPMAVGCSDNGKQEKSGLPLSLHRGDVIRIGRWRSAA